MAQSVPDPNDPVACVLGQPGAEDRETDFLNRRTRRDGRAIWLYQNLLPIQKRSKASCGENTSVFATLRTEARWGPLGPSGALWAPVLDFRGGVIFGYALGAFPPSLRPRHPPSHASQNQITTGNGCQCTPRQKLLVCIDCLRLSLY